MGGQRTQGVLGRWPSLGGFGCGSQAFGIGSDFAAAAAPWRQRPRVCLQLGEQMQIALGVQRYVKYKELGVQLNMKHRALGMQLAAMKTPKTQKKVKRSGSSKACNGARVY